MTTLLNISQKKPGQQLLLFMLISFAGFIIAGMVQFTIVVTNQNQDITANIYILKLLLLSSHILGLGLPVLFWGYYYNIYPIEQNLHFYKTPLSIVGLSILFYLIWMPSVNWLGYVNQHLPLPEKFLIGITSQEEQKNQIVRTLFKHSDFLNQITTLLLVGVVPAITEELTFRSILQPIFQKIFKNNWVGIIITALLFATIHFQFLTILPRFVLGLILGVVFHFTKSILPSILLHFINNSMQVILVFALGNEYLEKSLKNTDIVMPYYLGIIFTIIAAALSVYLFKKNKAKITS